MHPTAFRALEKTLQGTRLSRPMPATNRRGESSRPGWMCGRFVRACRRGMIRYRLPEV